MSASFRKPAAHKLPLQRGLLRVTGETLEGPRECDAFDVVTAPGGELCLVLLDVHTRDEDRAGRYPEGWPAHVSRSLLRKAQRGLAERAPLHAVMLDLVRALLDFPSTELRVTLLRCAVAEARVELSIAGMPPAVCARAGGALSVHASSSPPLTVATTLPPNVEVSPLEWGSTWLLVSDGVTSGSRAPDIVRRLATELSLGERGLALCGETPDALYDLLADRITMSGRFARDDATLVLLGADPNARFGSGIERGHLP